MNGEIKLDENPLKNVVLEGPKALTNAEQYSPLNNMVEEIRLKAETDYSSTELYSDFVQDQVLKNPLDSFVPNKIKFSDYSIDPMKAYVRLNSGSLVPRFKDYLPNINNEDRLAREQSWQQKWLNGVSKFATTTGTTILGGTVGSVYGIMKLIGDGSFQSVFDNGFTKTMDDWNTRMRYELPNHYSEQERQKSLFAGLGTPNFWADKVLGAVGFTVGAIISEGIWAAITGGASLATSAARVANIFGKAGRWATATLGAERYAKNVASYKSLGKKLAERAFSKGDDVLNKNLTIATAKTVDGLNTARFLYTSSGYEAGVEALQYKKQAEESFYTNFREINGREPTSEEISQFKGHLDKSANAVFAGNMAILAPSNMVMFGSLFNIKNPLRFSGVNKTLFGVGTEKTLDGAGKVVYKAITPNRAQKIFSGVYTTAKPILTEGVWEEGGQGTLSSTAGAWIESGYDPKYSSENMALMDAMHEGLAYNFGTKEGLEQVLIGSIIGGSASVIQGGGRPIQLRQLQEARKLQTDKIESGLNTFAADIMAKRIVMSNKIKNAVERQKVAVDRGRNVEAELANEDVLIAELEFRHSIGEDIRDLVSSYRVALDNITPEQWAEQGVEDPESYKETVIDAYQSLVKRYRTNMSYAQAVFGIPSSQLIADQTEKGTYAQALAYTLTVGENASIMMEDSLEQIADIVGEDTVRAVKVEDELRRLDRNDYQKIFTRNRKIASLNEQREKITQRIQKIQNTPEGLERNEAKGRQLGELNAKFLEINAQISELEQERNNSAEKISQERDRRRGVQKSSEELTLSDIITGEDLARVEENLENMDNLIKSYKGKNPQLYQQLINLSYHYKQSQKSFEDYNNAAIALSSGNVKLRTRRAGGLLGKLINPSKDSNTTFTKEFLTDLFTNYVEAKQRAGGAIQEETISYDELQEQPTPEIVDNIANKIYNIQRLTKNEQKVYDDNKSLVDNRVQQLNDELGANPFSQTQTVEPEEGMEDELSYLKKRLDKALKNEYFSLQYLGEDADELLKRKPSTADIDRFRELNVKDRTAEEEIEFDSLLVTLGEWKLLDSAMLGSESIADVLNLIQQLETQIDEQEVREIRVDEMPAVVDDIIKQNEKTVYELSQNTNANATVKADKNGNYKLAHVKIQNVLGRLGGTVSIIPPDTKKPVQATDSNIEKYRIVPNTIFKVTIGDNSYDLRMREGAAIEISEEDFNEIQDDLNMYVVNTGTNWTYQDLYEKVGDSYRPIESDFVDDTINGDINELQEGDELEFHYDSEDPWNLQLSERFDKGEVDEKYYKDNIKVHLRKNGKNYGTLKATRRGQGDDNLLRIRDKAFRASRGGVSITFGSTKLNQVIISSPVLSFDGNRSPREFEFTDRAKESVEATGYVQNNRLTLSDKTLEDKAEHTFVAKFSEENPEKKIPIVVIKRGKNFVAVPINFIRKPAPATQYLEAILNDSSTNDVQKVGRINNLLIGLNIAPSQFNLIDLTDQQKLVDIGTALADRTVQKSVDEFASTEYPKSELSLDATSNIDLENVTQTVNATKFRMDLNNHIIYETKEVFSEMLSDLDFELSDLSLKFFKALNKETAITDTEFDEIIIDGGLSNVTEKDPTQWITARANAKVMERALEHFSNLENRKYKKDIVNTVGSENIDRALRILKKRGVLAEQTKVPSNVADTKNDMKCE